MIGEDQTGALHHLSANSALTAGVLQPGALQQWLVHLWADGERDDAFGPGAVVVPGRVRLAVPVGGPGLDPGSPVVDAASPPLPGWVGALRRGWLVAHHKARKEVVVQLDGAFLRGELVCAPCGGGGGQTRF